MAKDDEPDPEPRSLTISGDGTVEASDEELPADLLRAIEDIAHIHGAPVGSPERYRRRLEVGARRDREQAEKDRAQAEKDRATASKRFWVALLVSILLGGTGLVVSLTRDPTINVQPPVVNVPAPIVTVVAPPPALPPG